MWGFWMFCLVPLFFFMMMTRYCRRERWETGATRGPFGLERELDEQRNYSDALERRVADLEERLDFTERLLARRAGVES
jgi:hypothetical protein